MSAKEEIGDAKGAEKPAKSRRQRADDDIYEAESKSPTKSSPDIKTSDAKGKPRESAARTAAATVDDGGGWFDSSPKKGRRNAPVEVAQPEEDDEQENMSSTRRNNHRGDDDDDILIIPDLDDEGGGFAEGGDARIAQAPRNVHRKIPTLAELENAVQATMPTVQEAGYDLAVLTATLVPAAGLEEADEVWDFDGLLRDVTDELTSTPKTVISATISSSTVAAMAKEKKSLSSSKKPSKR